MRRAAYWIIMAFLASATTLSGCSSTSTTSAPDATPVSQAPAPSSTPGKEPEAIPPVSWSLAIRSVADAPYRTLAMKPVTGCADTAVTRDGRIVLSCLPPDSPKGSGTTGIFIIDPCSGVETMVVDPRVEGGSIGPGCADGDWLVYARSNASEAIIARNTRTGERIEVGRIAAGFVNSPIGPAYAISGSRIAWADESLAPDGKRSESIVVFDLDDRTSRTVATLPPSTVADTVSLAGDLLVWSQTDITDTANVSCDVYSCLLSTGEVRRLSHDGRASMPCTNGAYVVWKITYSRFACGGIYLYEVATGRGQEIAGAVAGESCYDMPTIGQDYVTFISVDLDRIPLYHLRDGTTEALANGGGRTYTAGHYVVWVGDTVTKKQDWYLLWADLSMPNTSSATPPPCTPLALPAEPGPTSAGPAISPSPTPERTSDVTGWPIYEDTTQRYRLRYPAGASIATDQYGYTTFTLTDNKTTYAVRLQKGEAPAGVDRPALILETIDQGIGLFDIGEIQELTINGVQAALVAYSGEAVQEPCSTYRHQKAAFLVGKQLYELTFEVAGPGQCDATAVPWFGQMLHSFEPY